MVNRNRGLAAILSLVFVASLAVVSVKQSYFEGNVSGNVATDKKVSGSQNAVKAVTEEMDEESGMQYLQADASGNLEKEDAEKGAPVSVKITYYLDDKEMRPEDLVGQSGKLKMRFEYENRVQKTVEVDGEQLEVQVPFMVMSAVIMPTDVFSNIEVSQGKIMEDEDQNIAIGTAFPGLKESLRLEEVDKDNKINLADSVEITADVKEFELDFTANIIAPLGLSDMESDSFDDIDKLGDNMDKLGTSSDALVSATGQLLEGLQTFQVAMESYTQGVEQLQSGIKAINDVLAKTTNHGGAEGEAAMKAAQGLAKDAESLAQLLGQMQTSLDTMQTFVENVTAYKGQVDSNISTAKTSLDAAQEALNGVASEAEVQVQAEVNKAKSAVESVDGLDDEQKAAVKRAIENAVNTNDIMLSADIDGASGNISNAQTALSNVPTVLDIPDLSSLAQGKQNIAKIIADMQKQLQVLAGFSQNMGGVSDGLATLSSSLKALETGGWTINR